MTQDYIDSNRVDVDAIIERVSSTVTTDVIKEEMRAKLEEFNRMIIRNKVSLEEDLKIVSNHLDQSLYKVRDELLTTANVHKDQLMQKFHNIPEQVSDLLPSLIDQSLLDAAVDRAKGEILVYNQDQEVRLKESLEGMLKQSEERLIKAKEEFLEEQMKDIKNKLAVSHI